MLAASSESSKLVELIATGRSRFDSRAFRVLREAASLWKPPAYNAAVGMRRDYYRGDQAAWVRRDLVRRYPNTHQFLTPYCTPLVRHLVEQQATIYKSPPRREVVDGDQSFVDRLYSEANVSAHLQYAEEVACAAGVSFVRASWDAVDERVHLDVYWPDRVDVICDASRPDRIDLAQVLIAERVGSSGVRSPDHLPPDERKRWEVWSRADDGWRRIDVDNGGRTWTEDPARYDVLPFVAMFGHRPSGLLFEQPPSDDVEVNNAIDAMYTDLLYTVSMQSAPQVTYVGRDKGRTLTAGPGSVWSATDGAFGVMNFAPPISQVKEAAREIVGQLLVLRGVSPSAASADPRYESGVALKVQQSPMLERRAARVPFARDFEERRLWPVLRAVYESGAGVDLAGASLRWHPGELQLPLDDEAEHRVAEAQVSAGVTTWEDVMVKRGMARDLDDARLKRAANKIASVEAESAPSAELNGAQVTAVVTVAQQVAAGLIPRDTGVAIVARALLMPPADADALMGTAGRGAPVAVDDEAVA